MPNTPKTAQKDAPPQLSQHPADNMQYSEDDNISLVSLGSYISQSFTTLDMAETAPESMTLSPSTATVPTAVDPMNVPPSISPQRQSDDEPIESDTTPIFIGTIYDQSLIMYTSRLVTSKFLLTGQCHQLIPDEKIRVSIKNTALMVLANCVRLWPHSFLETVESDVSEEFLRIINEVENLCDYEDMKTGISGPSLTPTVKPNSELNIIDDYFADDKSKAASEGGEQTTVVVVENIIKNDAELLTEDIEEKEMTSSAPFNFAIKKMLTTSETQLLKPRQLIQDVCLYYDHSDPILRGNVQIIVGNFLATYFQRHLNLDYEGGSVSSNGRKPAFISTNKLLFILMKVSYYYNIISFGWHMPIKH